MHHGFARRAAALTLCVLMLVLQSTPVFAAGMATREREAFLDELSALPHYQEQRSERYLNYLGSKDFTPEQVLRLVNTDADLPPYEGPAETDVSLGALMLVNKHNTLGKYVPKNLVRMGSCGSWGYMERTAHDAFVLLVNAAKKDGYRIWGVSPYRGWDLQDYLYENYCRAHGAEEADTYSARPGFSEHQTGFAVDVAVRGESYGSFEGTAESEWMRQHAHEYGFILRYGEDTEYITGYIYEPWHYRYVGVEAAAYIFEHDLTFEEYYYYYVVGDEMP